MYCNQCGISFLLHEKGYLYINTTENLSAYKLEPHGDEWWYIPYDNHQELLERIQLLTKAQDQSLSALCLKRKIPSAGIPLKNLIIQLQNKNTISIIQSGELISFLQPIIDLQKDDQLFGYESLLRTKEDNDISPGALFSTAAKAGMLSLLDQRAREAAIRAKNLFIPKGVKSFINFLPSTIYNPDFCLQHTFHLVNKYAIDPADLVFEVVESEQIEDMGHLKKVLQTYKREGMKVALDDVGAGYSTLEVLKMLDPDFVKIDRQFIQFCDQESRKQQFLGEVMELANELDITVLAEGIERKEELEYCRSLGVQLAQGFFIGKPSPNPDYKTVSAN